MAGDNDDEACAALLAFATAPDGASDAEKEEAEAGGDKAHSSKIRTKPDSAPEKGASGGRKRKRDHDDAEYTEVFPIQKIASVMKRVLPPSAVISREAKQAVQACVCEFICFLTSEACDIREETEMVDADDKHGDSEGDTPVASASASSKAVRSLTSERILKAFCHLGFDKYSDVCQTYIERYRHHLNSAAVQETRPKKKQTEPSPVQAPVEESSSGDLETVEKVCPMQSDIGCMVEDAPEDCSESTSSQRVSSASSVPAVSTVDSAVAMAASQLYSPLERARHVFNPPQSPNVHAIKSLRDASVEVATSLVYAWSRPIVESALLLAGSPSLVPQRSPALAPTPFPSPMMSPSMSPMFLSRLGMSLGPPVLSPNVIHQQQQQKSQFDAFRMRLAARQQLQRQQLQEQLRQQQQMQQMQMSDDPRQRTTLDALKSAKEPELEPEMEPLKLSSLDAAESALPDASAKEPLESCKDDVPVDISAGAEPAPMIVDCPTETMLMDALS